MKIASIEPGHRIRLPVEWAEALGFKQWAELERTAEGILIRPRRSATWDEVFADKLTGKHEILSAPDSAEANGDDLLL